MRRMLAIALVFAATRLLVAGLIAPELRSGDQAHYLRSASSILAHGWRAYLDPGFVIEPGDDYPYYSGTPAMPDGRYNPIFWDPLYPLFLAVVFEVFGPSHAAVVAVQLLLSLATLLLGIDAVRRMFPAHARAASACGWLFVAYLPLAGFVALVLGETLDAFLLTALVWVATRLPQGALKTCFAFGVLLGLYASIRSYTLQLVPVWLALLGWMLARSAPPRFDWRGAGARVALVALGAALVLLPTYVRNHNLSGAWLLSTKGPWNLWKDNNNFIVVAHDWREPPGAGVHRWLELYHLFGSVERVSAALPPEGVYDDPSVPVARPPCNAALADLYACEQRAAIAFFFESPLRFARRALVKIANLWSPNDYVFNRAPPGPLAWHQNYRFELPTALRWLLQLWVIAVYLLALLLFFVGITAPAESAAHRFVRAIVVLYLVYLVGVVTPWGHGVTRFRLPLMVPILMFSALGLTRLRGAGWAATLGFTTGRAPFAIRTALAALLLAVCAVKLPLLLAP